MMNTVDIERFTGLKVRFQPHEAFAEILSCCPGQKWSLFRIIEERCLYLQENFRGFLENHEKCESLAQQILLHLQYSSNVN